MTLITLCCFNRSMQENFNINTHSLHLLFKRLQGKTETELHSSDPHTATLLPCFTANRLECQLGFPDTCQGDFSHLFLGRLLGIILLQCLTVLKAGSVWGRSDVNEAVVCEHVERVAKYSLRRELMGRERETQKALAWAGASGEHSTHISWDWNALRSLTFMSPFFLRKSYQMRSPASYRCIIYKGTHLIKTFPVLLAQTYFNSTWRGKKKSQWSSVTQKRCFLCLML